MRRLPPWIPRTEGRLAFHAVSVSGRLFVNPALAKGLGTQRAVIT